MRERIRRERALFLVNRPRRQRKMKPGAMCRFNKGCNVVQVWSRTAEEHAAALAVYKARKWELIEGPINTGYSETPYRSRVRRKIAMRDEP